MVYQFFFVNDLFISKKATAVQFSLINDFDITA